MQLIWQVEHPLKNDDHKARYSNRPQKKFFTRMIPVTLRKNNVNLTAGYHHVYAAIICALLFTLTR